MSAEEQSRIRIPKSLTCRSKISRCEIVSPNSLDSWNNSTTKGGSIRSIVVAIVMLFAGNSIPSLHQQCSRMGNFNLKMGRFQHFYN